MIGKNDIFHDLILSIPLFFWVLFVTQFLAKWVANFALKKGYPKDSATYFGRKIIHIFASAVVAILLPFFFREPFVPFFYGTFFSNLYFFTPQNGKTF